MAVATYVDIDGPVRNWVRTVVPAVSNRVFFGISSSWENIVWPLVLMTPISTGINPYTPDMPCDYQFDCWSAPLSRSGSKIEADTIALQLVNAIENAEKPFDLSAQLRVLDAQVTSLRWSPDPDTAQPRRIVDTTFTVTPLA